MRRNLAVAAVAVALVATSAYAEDRAPRAGAAGPSDTSRLFPAPSFIDYPAMAQWGEASAGTSVRDERDMRVAGAPQPSFVDYPTQAQWGETSAGTSVRDEPDTRVVGVPQPSFVDYPPMAQWGEASAGSSATPPMARR